MRSRFAIIIAMALVIALGPEANADRRGWITTGIGVNSFGSGGYFTLSLKLNNTVFSFRYFQYTEGQKGMFTGREPDESSHEFSFLVGIGDENKKERIRMVAVGLGVVNSVRRGAVIDEHRFLSGPLHEKLTSSVLGVALHAEYYFSKRFGLSALGNLNDAEPYVSACLCIRLVSW